MSTLRDRFFSKVAKIETPMADCWLWTASVDSVGYGRIGVNGRVCKAHRVSYEMQNGPIPDGMLVLHRCDNPRCVNPAHLFLGTARDNTQDASRKGRLSRGERHHSSKLTRRSVLAIRAAFEAGSPKREIARRFGVTPPAIRAVLSGRWWRHV